jgi:hypothetical protein
MRKTIVLLALASFSASIAGAPALFFRHRDEQVLSAEDAVKKIQDAIKNRRNEQVAIASSEGLLISLADLLPPKCKPLRLSIRSNAPLAWEGIVAGGAPGTICIGDEVPVPIILVLEFRDDKNRDKPFTVIIKIVRPRS